MGSSPSVTTVKKEPYAYDPWFKSWAGGMNNVLMGSSYSPGTAGSYVYTPGAPKWENYTVDVGERGPFERRRQVQTPGTYTYVPGTPATQESSGLFDLLSNANNQYMDLASGFNNIYSQAMAGYDRLSRGELDPARKAVIDRQLNDAMKTAIGDRLTQWADRGVMGGTTVSDSMGELSREAADTWMRNYFQALADERAAYDAMLSGYNTATTAALKPYTVLDPVMEGFSRIHSDYYNDPQDTVASGGK